jgi:hypothetical protein
MRERETTTMKPHYVWEESYEAAMLGTDDKNLPNLLQTAKAAIDTRLHQLQFDGGSPEERQAITDALGGLNVLRENGKYARAKQGRAMLERRQ